MSEMEHEKTTEEMFAVVNNHASDESKRHADQVVKKMQEAEDASAQAKKDREKVSKRAKIIIELVLRLLICMAAAAFFLTALLIPGWVPVLCLAGMAVCLVIGAIATDRCIQAWR